MNSSQLSTALIKFGKSVWSAKQSASESILKRAQRSKIGVQPSAVIRRKTNRKGKRALPLAKVHLFSLERYQQRKENVTWLKISAKTRAVLSRTMFWWNRGTIKKDKTNWLPALQKERDKFCNSYLYTLIFICVETFLAVCQDSWLLN